jgi:hypothetical protein
MSPPTRTAAAIEGRRADTARRRERVLTAITDTIAIGSDITAAAIAQRARRPQLPLPPPRPARTTPRRPSPTAPRQHSRPGRQSGITAGRPARRARTRRPPRHPQPAARTAPIHSARPAAWRESGLAAPHDIDQLTHRITDLEQQILDLKLKLDERDQDLAAARAANRELITRLNTTG